VEEMAQFLTQDDNEKYSGESLAQKKRKENPGKDGNDLSATTNASSVDDLANLSPKKKCRRSKKEKCRKAYSPSSQSSSSSCSWSSPSEKRKANSGNEDNYSVATSSSDSGDLASPSPKKKRRRPKKERRRKDYSSTPTSFFARSPLQTAANKIFGYMTPKQHNVNRSLARNRGRREIDFSEPAATNASMKSGGASKTASSHNEAFRDSLQFLTQPSPGDKERQVSGSHNNKKPDDNSVLDMNQPAKLDLNSPSSMYSPSGSDTRSSPKLSQESSSSGQSHVNDRDEEDLFTQEVGGMDWLDKPLS
jgi:hypothetical protein